MDPFLTFRFYRHWHTAWGASASTVAVCVLECQIIMALIFAHKELSSLIYRESLLMSVANLYHNTHTCLQPNIYDEHFSFIVGISYV